MDDIFKDRTATIGGFVVERMKITGVDCHAKDAGRCAFGKALKGESGSNAIFAGLEDERG